MKANYWPAIGLAVLLWAHPGIAQQPRLGVCEALDSGVDHQEVVLHGKIASTVHDFYLFEGNGRDPCPGWPKNWFTAPAAIPLVVSTYSDIQVPINLTRNLFDYSRDLRQFLGANRFVAPTATVKGTLVRKPVPLIFRFSDGSYAGWGEGFEGGSAAVLVLKSVPIQDR